MNDIDLFEQNMAQDLERWKYYKGMASTYKWWNSAPAVSYISTYPQATRIVSFPEYPQTRIQFIEEAPKAWRGTVSEKLKCLLGIGILGTLLGRLARFVARVFGRKGTAD